MSQLSTSQRPLFCFKFGTWCFSPNLIPSLASLLLFPFLLSLGFWQLDRAEQKRELTQAYQLRSESAAVDLSQVTKDPSNWRFQPLTMTGQLLNEKQFLLDNRTHQGRAGYHVLTPFVHPDHNKLVLINRGFIEVGADRRFLPDISINTSKITLSGRLYLPPDKDFTLASEPELTANTWPRVIQSIDFKYLEQQLGRPLYPFLVQLSPNSPHGYLRDWQAVSFPSYKHIGYAVQWFALALTLLILYITVNTHRQRATDGTD